MATYRKITLTNIIDELRKPENSKTIKILFLTMIAALGISASVNMISSGLDLLIQCGVSINTLKLIMGSTACVTGYFLLIWFLVKPASFIGKLVSKQ